MNATYDRLNQLTGVTIGGDTTEYGYDKNGNILNKTTGQLITEYAYNQGNMLTQMATTHPNKSYPVNEYAASYYMDGNLKLKEGSQWAEYTYDGLGRLITDNGPMSTDYTYDAYGNITRKFQQQGGPDYEDTTYTYNANNQLMKETMEEVNLLYEETYSQTVVSYTYDPNGNLTSKLPQSFRKSGSPESLALSVFGETDLEGLSQEQYTYDGFGQRTGAIVNDKTATYSYNPEGLRVSKTVNGETTTHILDGSNVVADVKGGNISKYNRGRGLISIEQNAKKGYYVFNGHGDVTQIIDSAGVTKDSFDFTAFGERAFAYSDTESFHNPFGYAGEYTDRETDHIYLRARYYEPATGRFTSQDPAKSGTNWYIYCNNNPVMFIDPMGLEEGDIYGRPDDAAIDFALKYLPLSLEDELEYGAYIYEIELDGGVKGYTYTIVTKGEHDSVTLLPPPSGYKKVAMIHTHPTDLSGSLSSGDLIESEHKKKITMYVASAVGVLVKHDPRKERGKKDSIVTNALMRLAKYDDGSANSERVKRFMGYAPETKVEEIKRTLTHNKRVFEISAFTSQHAEKGNLDIEYVKGLYDTAPSLKFEGDPRMHESPVEIGHQFKSQN